MNSTEQLRTAFGMLKEAKPKWVKMLSSISPRSTAELTNFLPSTAARQVGRKAIGRGQEGAIFPAFVGQKGHAVVKNLTNPVIHKRFDAEAKRYNIPAKYLTYQQRADFMRANADNGFMSVYKSHPKGYFAERLRPLNNSSWQPSHRTEDYMRATHKLEANKRLVSIYQSKIDKSNFLVRSVANLLKNYIPSPYSRAVKSMTATSDKIKTMLQRDPRTRSVVDTDMSEATARAALMNKLFGLGGVGKPNAISPQALISENGRVPRRIKQLDVSPSYALSRLPGRTFDGKPLHMGDVDFNDMHNIMARADGSYVVSDPLLATM